MRGYKEGLEGFGEFELADRLFEVGGHLGEEGAVVLCCEAQCAHPDVLEPAQHAHHFGVPLGPELAEGLAAQAPLGAQARALSQQATKHSRM